MIAWPELLLRLFLAALFGGLIGLERERKSWTAGLRTHMMVCVGSCLIMVVSAFGFADILGTPNVTLDPSRIAAQVISGIGFIGAGTILFMREGTVHGLTTAAGLWTVAAIGLAAGGGLYFAAGATTFIALIILWALKPLENAYSRRFKQRTLRIVTGHHINKAELLQLILDKIKIDLKTFSLEKVENDCVYLLEFEKNSTVSLEELTESLSKLDIREMHWVQ